MIPAQSRDLRPTQSPGHRADERPSHPPPAQSRGQERREEPDPLHQGLPPAAIGPNALGRQQEFQELPSAPAPSLRVLQASAYLSPSATALYIDPQMLQIHQSMGTYLAREMCTIGVDQLPSLQDLARSTFNMMDERANRGAKAAATEQPRSKPPEEQPLDSARNGSPQVRPIISVTHPEGGGDEAQAQPLSQDVRTTANSRSPSQDASPGTSAGEKQPVATRKQRRDDVKEAYTPESRERYKRARDQEFIDSLTPEQRDDFLKRKKAEEEVRQRAEEVKRRAHEAWLHSQRRRP